MGNQSIGLFPNPKPRTGTLGGAQQMNAALRQFKMIPVPHQRGKILRQAAQHRILAGLGHLADGEPADLLLPRLDLGPLGRRQQLGPQTNPHAFHIVLANSSVGSANSELSSKICAGSTCAAANSLRDADTISSIIAAVISK